MNLFIQKGLGTESFNRGPMALSVDRESSRTELQAIFTEADSPRRDLFIATCRQA